jgi:hypothetical protein
VAVKVIKQKEKERRKKRTKEKGKNMIAAFLDKTVSMKLVILIAASCVVLSAAISVSVTLVTYKPEPVPPIRSSFWSQPSKTIVGDEPEVKWR